MNVRSMWFSVVNLDGPFESMVGKGEWMTSKGLALYDLTMWDLLPNIDWLMVIAHFLTFVINPRASLHYKHWWSVTVDHALLLSRSNVARWKPYVSVNPCWTLQQFDMEARLLVTSVTKACRPFPSSRWDTTNHSWLDCIRDRNYSPTTINYLHLLL